jgi:hypothetical protein
MKEALKLALEALDSQYILGCGEWRGQQLKAITAIKEALAQPAQEPDIYPEEARDMGLEALAYYTAPPAAQPAPDCKETGVCVQTGLACFGQAAQPAQEPHNFCPRCGKRVQGVLGRPQMHTCTPPLWGHT